MEKSSLAPASSFEIANGSGLHLQFGPGGNLLAIRHESVLINQVIPCAVEDGLFRLVARKKGASIDVVPLLGLAAEGTRLEISPSSISWRGEQDEVEYETSVLLHARLSAWFWCVRLRNKTGAPATFDLLYGQDLGLAHENAVRNNEAYVSQYIDHLPVETPLGPIVLSRQNQAQAQNHFPWIAQGCLDGTVAYGTDGFQFFGADHRLTGIPSAWSAPHLPSLRRQYEFAYVALQSREVRLMPDEEAGITFFAYYLSDHPAASSADEIASVLEKVTRPERPIRRDTPARPSPATVFSRAPVLAGCALSTDACRELFPGDWRQVEERDGELLAFFHDESRHAVTRAKETLVERPHGHLLYSGDSLWPDPDVLGTTVYAAGIFNAQVFLGNTNLVRFLSVVRNALNVMRASGQRVFVKIGGAWAQLGVPSVFDLGPHDARWIYHLGDRVVEARTWCWPDRPAVTLDLRVTHGEPLEFLITHHLALGADELTMPDEVTADAASGWITSFAAKGCLLDQHLPGSGLLILADSPDKIARLGGGELLSGGGTLPPVPFATVETRALSACSITLAPLGREAEPIPDLVRTLRKRLSVGGDSATRPALPLADLKLEHGDDTEVSRLGEAVPWLAHNAAIHLVVPHGLEQYSGAAWGVRDVCQGPVEWLLAAGRHAEVRRIVLDVFAQQYEDDGSWPQWYMHPPFAFIRQEHAHGDIPFWPLKALGDYVEASNDFSILHEAVAYQARSKSQRSRKDESLLRHADRIVEHYRGRRIAGTDLINYGDGDWDDTLQPADPALRSTMVSSWTVGLVFHTFRLWRDVCLRANESARAEELAHLLTGIRRDFHRLLILDGQTCGFAIWEGNRFRPLLHPSDTITGIRHRLLPMTRAILAELFDLDEARHHAGLIREHLLFPDGVRLMSSVVPYRGGVETIFKRAETAANFGREIGLQYVHAHLRYAEAMARLGDADALWQALQVVNPVNLSSRLPHAALRQSNAYFSSSDGDFIDRYEAAAHFDRLRDGSVSVKGGWRVYSSGPGLYLNKIVGCLLGWREHFGEIVLDPVLPTALAGLTARFFRGGKAIELRYRVRQGTHTPKAIALNGRSLDLTPPLEQPYRSGGVRIPPNALDREKNQIDVEL
jgi:cellobiose phosphorylase